jgi:hypothetical protein
VVVLVKVPEVPVTVTVAVPIAAELVADRVRALPVVAGLVPNVALTPFGRPDALKLTLPLNPLRRLIVIVVEAEVPWTTVKLAGDADSVKPGDEEAGQLLTKLAALTVPIPVAKSHPTLVP